jgi:hypothetical protein
LNAIARRGVAPAGEVVAELVREADDRALLTDAEESWRRFGADPRALATYRGETTELQSFDSPLPEY